MSQQASDNTADELLDHLATLQSIADRWAGLGYFKTPDRALKALILGVS